MCTKTWTSSNFFIIVFWNSVGVFLIRWFCFDLYQPLRLPYLSIFSLICIDALCCFKDSSFLQFSLHTVTNTLVCFAVQRSIFILSESVSALSVSYSLSTFLIVGGGDIIELLLRLGGGDIIELLPDAGDMLLDNDDVDKGVMEPKKSGIPLLVWVAKENACRWHSMYCW